MKVKLLTPVRHDGKDHKAGAVIEVTDAAGEALLASQGAERTKEKPAPAPLAAPVPPETAGKDEQPPGGDA